MFSAVSPREDQALNARGGAMPVLQRTLNENVNLDAVRAYASRLLVNAGNIEADGWPGEPTPEQAAALKALRAAAAAVSAACDLAASAEQLASEVHYDHIYNRNRGGKSAGTGPLPGPAAEHPQRAAQPDDHAQDLDLQP
jgi:hypothetical protein